MNERRAPWFQSRAVVLSEARPRRDPRSPPIRCLFITWNDGHPPSQFTVPNDYHLPRARRLRRRIPPLTFFNDDAETELLLQTRLIRSAYLLTLDDGQRVVDLSAA